MHRGTTGDLQAYSILRVVAVISDVLLSGFIVFGKARHMGRDQHAVAHFNGADLQGAQQVLKSAHRRGRAGVHCTLLCAQEITDSNKRCDWRIGSATGACMPKRVQTR